MSSWTAQASWALKQSAGRGWPYGGLRACWEKSAPTPARTPDTVMASAGRPPTTFSRPALQVVDGAFARHDDGIIGLAQPIRLFPDGSLVLVPASTPCRASVGRSRGWRAFAR